MRLLGGTDKELCEGEVLLQVERDGEPRQVVICYEVTCAP